MAPQDPLSMVFAALAHPVRRQMLARLRQGTATATDLTPADISKPAVTKHLHTLEKAGLITRHQGTDARLLYSALDPRPLLEVAQWLDGYRQLWDDRLDRLEDFLAEQKEHDN